jgi:hypothetical protein
MVRPSWTTNVRGPLAVEQNSAPEGEGHRRAGRRAVAVSTSSARSRIDSGTARPSAVAVLEVHDHLELGRKLNG